MDLAREQIKDNRRPSSAGHRFWELSGGIGRCAACNRVLRSRKRSKTKGGRRYQYFYYRCSGFDSHGSEGCENSRHASATKLEGQVWDFVRGALLDPAELCSDLDRAIELERDGRRGDPEAEAKHWLDKLSEVEEERRGFLRLAAKGRITDDELDEELAQLDNTRKVAEQELEALRWHKERVEEMERDREAVLEHYAALAPDALDALISGGASPALQDAKAQGASGQERGLGDRACRRSGGKHGRGWFFHNGGHIEICPHGRPIVKRLRAPRSAARVWQTLESAVAAYRFNLLVALKSRVYAATRTLIAPSAST